jgi:hypothetical protein
MTLVLSYLVTVYDNLFFQILNVVIIYAKLPFERPIGNAFLTLQEVENLSDDIVKFHHRLPAIWASPLGVMVYHRPKRATKEGLIAREIASYLDAVKKATGSVN